jgi:hypothetical protein
MGPAQQKLKTAWLPVGAERAMALQVGGARPSDTSPGA